MNVRELKALLEDFDDNALVIVSNDDTYVEADGAVLGYYFEEGWSGDFVEESEAQDDEDINTDEAVPAVLIE